MHNTQLCPRDVASRGSRHHNHLSAAHALGAAGNERDAREQGEEELGLTAEVSRGAGWRRAFCTGDAFRGLEMSPCMESWR
jgi:hypothetical protein